MSGERHDDGDDESDLSDDPILSSLNTDLESVQRFTDNRLFIFVGAARAAAYLPDDLHVPPRAASVFYADAVTCIIGGIGFTIFSVIKGKHKVAERYGLVCQACGNRPRTSHILFTARIGQCAACGKQLNVHKP